MTAPTAAASALAAGSVGTVETQLSRPAEPGAARLRTGAPPGPRRLRDLRHALAPAGQRDPRLPRAQRRCPRGRLLDGGGAAEHPRRVRRRRPRRRRPGKGLGWWDGMIGPGKAFDTDRYFVVSTNLLGGCRGTTGPSSLDPATGRPYGLGLPGDHRRGHGENRARVPGRARNRAARGGGRRLARRACRRSSGRSCIPDQVDAVVAIASTHALHPQGVAWNAIAREAIMRDPAWRDGHYYGTDDAPNAGMGVARMIGHITYLSARGARRQVRPAAAVRRRHPLHGHRAGVRGRELPAPPGRLVRQAVRRQHLPLHVAGADVLRPRAAVRRRLAHARARGRLGADAADRLQLGLAVPAVGIAGDRRGAARARQAGRAPRDRRAVRPRLLPARRGAADADHPPLSRRASMTAERDRTRGGPRVRIRDAAAPRRAAARPEHRRSRGADLPDDQLRVRGPRVGRRRTSTCRSTGTRTRGS